MALGGFHFPWYGSILSDEPDGIFGGTEVATRPIPFTVSLYGVEYPIELKPYRRRSLDNIKPGGTTTSAQPDDSQFNNEGAWWRYVYDWSLGAGQVVQDFGQDRLPNRFASSLGIDPWTEFCAQLLPAVGLKDATAATNAFLIATGGFVYKSDGTGVKRSADLTTWFAITGLTGTIRDLATDGSACYIATSTHIYKVLDSGGVAATVVTVTGGDYSKVAFVSNRLLAAKLNVLYELNNAGVESAIVTHFQTAFRFTAVFNVGSRIYFGGYAGNRTELYGATTDSSGNLVVGAEAAQFPYNEQLLCGVSYAGAALLGTSLGIRLAILSGDGSLTYGPLIDAPGGVTAVTAEGRFAWFAWTDHPGGSGVGRLALDRQVTSLQPAYATDVYTAASSNDVTGVCRFGGKTVFHVPSSGVYATLATFLTTGYIESGQVYLGTIERKALSEVVARFDPLLAGETVRLITSDHIGDEMGDVTTDVDGAELLDSSLSGEQAAWIEMRVELTGSGASSPCLRSWRLRGFPVVPSNEEFIVPLIIHRYVVVNDGHGQLRSMNPLEQIERLIAAKESNTIITYREGLRSYRVRIDKYEMQPREWDDRSDFFEPLFTVRLITQ